MNEEETREILEYVVEHINCYRVNKDGKHQVEFEKGSKMHQAIETILNLLEKKNRTIQQLKDENRTLNRQAQQYFEQGIKKDKIIDLMAEELVKAHEWFYSEFDNYTKEDFIKYFERKVEEDK